MRKRFLFLLTADAIDVLYWQAFGGPASSHTLSHVQENWAKARACNAQPPSSEVRYLCHIDA